MYQQSSGEPLIGLSMLLFFAAYYLYFSFAQFKIAQKLGTPNAFFAFIPILNVWQLVTMAGKSAVWFVGCLIPFLNVIFVGILWMEIAKNINKAPALGLLNLFPFINLFTISLMAFGGGSAPRPESPFPPHKQEGPRQPMNVA
jgi:hypothetical protein